MHKSKQSFWFSFFKIAVLISSYVVIVYNFIYDDRLNAFLNASSYVNLNWVFIGIVLILMSLNWLIEAYKWTILVRPFQKISLFTGLKAILVGLSVAILTPNRTGEYAGRVWVLKPEYRWQAVSSTVIGSFAQTIVTVLFGVVGLVFFAINKNPYFIEKHYVYGIIILLLIAFIAYFFLPKIVKFFKVKNKIIFTKLVLGVKTQRTSELVKVFILSLARYVVFTIQFLLLFKAFGVEIGMFDFFISSFVFYLLLMFIPIITIAEPSVRGSVALMVFGLFSVNSIGILAASLTLWIVNIAFPTLFGGVLLLYIKK